MKFDFFLKKKSHIPLWNQYIKIQTAVNFIKIQKQFLMSLQHLNVYLCNNFLPFNQFIEQTNYTTSFQLIKHITVKTFAYFGCRVKQ